MVIGLRRPTCWSTEFTQLRSSDIGLLKDLLRVFGQAFDDVETYQGAVPRDEYLRALLARPHFIAIVARSGGDVIGGLAAYELEKFERERREIYIYDLAVAEQHRQKGRRQRADWRAERCRSSAWRVCDLRAGRPGRRARDQAL